MNLMMQYFKFCDLQNDLQLKKNIYIYCVCELYTYIGELLFLCLCALYTCKYFQRNSSNFISDFKGVVYITLVKKPIHFKHIA